MKLQNRLPLIIIAFLLLSVFLVCCKKYDAGDDPCPVCPRISSIYPSHGGAGEILTIHGKNFSKDYRSNIVKINGVQISRDSILGGTTDSISVFVPRSCGTGYVTVDLDDELTFSGVAPVFNYEYQYAVSYFAGNGTDSVVNGIGSYASFSRPTNICTDQSDNLYVVDSSNTVIRKITPTGNVTTYFKAGSSSYITAICFNSSNQLMFFEKNQNKLYYLQVNGNNVTAQPYSSLAPLNIIYEMIPGRTSSEFFVTDSFSRIRTLNIGVNVTLNDYAGNLGTGNVNGPVADASFTKPYKIYKNSTGTMYFTEPITGLIKRITNDTAYAFAGIGSTASYIDEIVADSASFRRPIDLVSSEDGSLFITENLTGRVRRISATNYVKALNETFLGPWGICKDSHDNIFVVENSGNTIRKIVKY